MAKRRLRDILCACAVILALPCSTYLIRAMERGPWLPAGMASDSLMVGDSSVSPDSVSGTEPFSPEDSLQSGDSLSLSDSLLLPDSLTLQDSLPLPDSIALPDSLAVSDSLALSDTARVLTKKDSLALRDSLRYVERMEKRRIRDSLKHVKDSIRWSLPRVLETVFLPDTLYYQRILSWNIGPYDNNYREARIDTTYNDWYTEYPFYKEDVDVTYLGTVGSAVQNANFFRRREFDVFKPYAPYLTYSFTPEDMPFYNTKSPYTELAYWGTLFAYKDKEELNVKFLHTQNITPELNFAIIVQRWKAAGLLERENTENNTFAANVNYLGKHYVGHIGFIHQNVDRQENGGVQDSYMVRDTTVDAKTIAINLTNASNKLSRNTVFIDHSYSIPFDFGKKRNRRKAGHDNEAFMETDTLLQQAGLPPADSAGQENVAALYASGDSLSSQDSLSVADSTVSSASDSALSIAPSPAGTSGLLSGGAVQQGGSAGLQKGNSMMAGTGSTGQPPEMPAEGGMTEEEKEAKRKADSIAFKTLGDGPMLTFGHIGELSRYYKFYTDEIDLGDQTGRDFYNNAFYINPTSSADSIRMFTVENKLFFKLQPWARDAVVSRIEGGVGHQWQNIYSFNPDMFLSGNSNVHYNNMYVYAGAGGKYKKYFDWNAAARYDFLGYYQNDFMVDADVGVSFYPFKDKTEPLRLEARFYTALKEPDYFSQRYYSNHYVWDNSFGKTSTTKVEAGVHIPKWDFDVSFGYALVNNYLYHDTLGIASQCGDLISVMSLYLRKNFKLWLFHLDNEVLFQLSSNQAVLPLPMLSAHLRWYIEFTAVKNALTIQIGADARYNTRYYAQAYNPALGVFQLQEQELIGNSPYIDVFVNLQWKRASIFLKCVNVAEGWPEKGAFSAYHYIMPKRAFKIGIHWPFYIH